MTNEEKIQEIASEYSSEILRSGAYYGAKEMAKWKDEYSSSPTLTLPTPMEVTLTYWKNF